MIWRVLLFAAVMVLQPKFVWADEPGNSQSPLQQMPQDLRNLHNLMRPCPNGDMPRPVQMLTQQIQQKYGETAVATALNEGGSFLVLFATDDMSTWTAIAVDARTRLACITSAGTSLQFINRNQEL